MSIEVDPLTAFVEVDVSGDVVEVEVVGQGEKGDPGGGAFDGDASDVPYTPATEGDWDPVPAQVAEALDELAGREVGGGAVDSVNGETGAVVLDAADVGALASGSGYNTANGWLKLDGSGTAPDSTLPASIARDSEVSAGLAGKVDTTDPRLSDARTPTAHVHAGGDVTSGTIATARLGSGTADSTVFLRGDQTWAAAGGSETLPASIIDAKGDLIVGTANDTAARLGVGTDGQVLTADSAETSGVKWAAASPFRKAGRYYLNGMSGGNFTPSLNQLYLTPLPFWYVTISAIAMQVVLGGGAGSVVRLGLYAWGDGEPSGSPIIDAGIVSATSSGVKEVAITPTNVTHACLAMVWQGGTPNAVSGLSTTGSQVGGMLVGSATAILGDSTFPATCWTVAGVTGALPSISSVGTLGDFAPRMLVKVV